MNTLLLLALLTGNQSDLGANEVSVSDRRMEQLVLAVEGLRSENAALRAQLEGLGRKIEGDREAVDVPEIEVQQKHAGQWVLHPTAGVPVYAKSQWIVSMRGSMRVYECIRNGRRVVPVDSVIYGDQGTGQQQAPATPTQSFSFGGQQ